MHTTTSRTRRRLLSFLLIFCLATTLVPAVSPAVYAAGNLPVQRVRVAGVELNETYRYLLKDGTRSATGTLDGKTCTAQFDPATGTLTLWNYDPAYNLGVLSYPKIGIDVTNSLADNRDLTIKLIGDNYVSAGNRVNSSIPGAHPKDLDYKAIGIYNRYGNITITADDAATLWVGSYVISYINRAASAYGIVAMNYNNYEGDFVGHNRGEIVISGKADVEVVAAGDGPYPHPSYGLKAGVSVSVLENASLYVTAASNSNNNIDRDQPSAYGISLTYGDILIDTAGDVFIDCGLDDIGLVGTVPAKVNFTQPLDSYKSPKVEHVGLMTLLATNPTGINTPNTFIRYYQEWIGGEFISHYIPDFDDSEFEYDIQSGTPGNVEGKCYGKNSSGNYILRLRLASVKPLVFTHSPAFDVPAGMNQDSIDKIDCKSGVSGGATLFGNYMTYKVISGPIWLRFTGSELCGTRPYAAQAATTAVLEVRNQYGQTGTITVTVGEVYAHMGFAASPQAVIPEGYTNTPIVEVKLSEMIKGGQPPLSYTKTSGPSWLNVNPSTGVVSGTRPATYQAAAQAEVTVNDNYPGSGLKTTIKIGRVFEPLVYTGGNFDIPSDLKNTPVDMVIVTSGFSGGVPFTTGRPYRYSLTDGPSWLKIDSLTGILSGTRPEVSQYETTAVVWAEDSAGSRVSTTIKVGEVVDPLVFQNSTAFNIPAGGYGSPVRVDVSSGARGGFPQYRYSMVSGPDWLDVENYNISGVNRGIIEGTRPMTAQSATTATIRATDKAGAGVSQNITITVGEVGAAFYAANPGVQIPEGMVGTAFTPIDISGWVSGGVKPYKIALDVIGQPPDWVLSLNPSTGVLSGTRPSYAERYGGDTIIIAVSDSSTPPQTRSIYIPVGDVRDPDGLRFMNDNYSGGVIYLPAGEVGTPIEPIDLSQYIKGGTAPINYYMDYDLGYMYNPAWLRPGAAGCSLSTAGVLNATRPAAPDTSQSAYFTVYDGYNSLLISIVVGEVYAPKVKIGGATDVPSGIPGSSMAALPALSASGGTGPYTFSLEGPSWLSINPSTGAVSAVGGVRPMQRLEETTAIIAVTDSDGDTSSAIIKVGAVTTAFMTTTSTYEIPEGIPGSAVAPITISGVSGGVGPYTYAKESGPSWLAVNASTGVVSASGNVRPGAPQDGAVLVVTVTDALNDVLYVDVTVGAVAYPPLTITGAFDVPDGEPGEALTPVNFFSGVSGGGGTYTFNMTGAPEWMEITSAGVLQATTGFRPLARVPASSALITAEDSYGEAATAVVRIGAVSLPAMTYTDEPVIDFGAPVTAITPIDLLAGLSGGSGTYTFSMTGGPAWLSVNATTGLVSGLRVGPSVASLLTVSVTDTLMGDILLISIPVGAVLDPSFTYTVTVINGEADKTPPEYSECENVIVTAGPAPEGFEFDKWAVRDGGVILAYDDIAETAFIMPDNPVTVEATYREVMVGDGFSITPSHAILAKEGDAAVLKAILDPDSVDVSNITWDVTAGGASADGYVVTSARTGTTWLNITSEGWAGIPSDDLPVTLLVTAVYEDGDTKYKASATVEILPKGLLGSPGDVASIRPLDTAVTVNKARKVGAMVPLLITRQPAKNFGMDALSAGSDIADTIRLYTVKKVKGVDEKTYLTPMATAPEGSAATGEFTARMCPYDDRYLEINADPGVKNNKKFKNVWIEILPSDKAGMGGDKDNWVVATRAVDLTAVTKYPKININVDGSLNKAFKDDRVTVTATSPDGICTIESYIGSEPAIKAEDISGTGNTAKLAMNGTPANKTYKTAFKVSVAGYDMPYASYGGVNDKGVACSVKVVSADPKLKLSQKSVALAGSRFYDELTPPDAAVIKLHSGDKNVTDEQIRGRVVDVSFAGKVTGTEEYKDIKIDYKKSTGEISVWPLEKAGNGSGYIVVWFEGGTKVTLPLSVTIHADNNCTVSSSTKAAAVNVRHEGGVYVGHKHGAEILTFPVTVNAANIFSGGWEIVSTGTGNSKQDFNSTENPHPLKGAIEAVGAGKNMAALRVYDDPGATAKLADWFKETPDKKNNNTKDKKIVLNIGSTDPLLAGKTFAVTLTVKHDSPGAAAKLTNSGKINVARPGDSVTAALTLKNTSSPIKDVDWGTPSCKNSDFVLGDVDIVNNTFTVRLKSERLSDNTVTMAKQTVYPEITLENGQKVTPGLTLTPVATAGKATQSVNAVTLYKATPNTGANVNLSITAPDGAKVGVAAIDSASYAKLGFEPGKGLDLIQSGGKTWTIAFENYKLPVMKQKGKKDVALKSSYSLKIQLWAEGTYLADANGNPIDEKGDRISAASGNIVPLKNADGKAVTKPTLVTVRVNIK